MNTAVDEAAPAWQALDDLSTGQKATAVLLLLLLDSDAPLIVDQPEDDLDNRFISEGVVPRIREAKQERQFVFSTHNGIDPLAFMQSLAGRIDDMRERAEIKCSLDDLEYVMEILDPELQGPAYELAEQIRASAETADR